MRKTYEFVSTDMDELDRLLVTGYEQFFGKTVMPGSPERLFISWVEDNQHNKTAQGCLSAPLILIGGNIMEAMLNFIPAPVAIVLMLAGFIALAIGGIRLGYKVTVKDLALELVKKAELSIMGSGQGAKKKKQVFAALRAKCPAAIRWAITDEVLDTVIEHAFDVMTAALCKKS